MGCYITSNMLSRHVGAITAKYTSTRATIHRRLVNGWVFYTASWGHIFRRNGTGVNITITVSIHACKVVAVSVERTLVRDPRPVVLLVRREHGDLVPPPPLSPSATGLLYIREPTTLAKAIAVLDSFLDNLNRAILIRTRSPREAVQILDTLVSKGEAFVFETPDSLPILYIEAASTGAYPKALWFLDRVYKDYVLEALRELLASGRLEIDPGTKYLNGVSDKKKAYKALRSLIRAL